MEIALSTIRFFNMMATPSQSHGHSPHFIISASVFGKCLITASENKNKKSLALPPPSKIPFLSLALPPPSKIPPRNASSQGFHVALQRRFRKSPAILLREESNWVFLAGGRGGSQRNKVKSPGGRLRKSTPVLKIETFMGDVADKKYRISKTVQEGVA